MANYQGKKRKRNQWIELAHLIRLYGDARVADAKKGGGDPLDWETIGIRLELALADLNAHITAMRRSLTP